MNEPNGLRKILHGISIGWNLVTSGLKDLIDDMKNWIREKLKWK